MVLYVWQADRGELAKFVFGGSGLGEWFSFLSDGAKRGDGCLTKPYKTVEGAETLIQFQTEFKANKTKSDKGLEYYRLSLGVGKMNTNDEMKALFDEQEKIDGYVMGWKAKRLEVASPVLMPEKEEKKLEEESLDALDVVAPVEEA